MIEPVEITEMMSENVPSTSSGTESSSKYKAVIEPVEITGKRNKNVPSTSSGTETDNKYNTVIEPVEITGMIKNSYIQCHPEWSVRVLSCRFINHKR